MTNRIFSNQGSTIINNVGCISVFNIFIDGYDNVAFPEAGSNA
jgi:hypothetical protein